MQHTSGIRAFNMVTLVKQSSGVLSPQLPPPLPSLHVSAVRITPRWVGNLDESFRTT